MRSIAAVLVLLAATIASADPNAKPPHGATKVLVDYSFVSFHRDQRNYVLEWKQGAYHWGKRTVPAKAVDALYAALTELRESAQPLQCISHTDDYPSFTIAVEGDEPITLASSSNCHLHVPWNVTVKGKANVQFNGAAGRAVAALLAIVDPDHWSKGGDDPDATTMLGGEYVGLGEYKAGQTATSDAASCAKDLESSAPARKMFGDAVSVSELVLACDLGQSPDCKLTIAGATFVWDGASVQLEVPCIKGKMDVSAKTAATIAEVRTFLDSKPVRTVIKLSSQPPRMWNNRGWRLESGEEDVPALDWTAGTKVIDVRAVGEQGPAGVKFWKALGLDAKKLTKAPRDGFYETSATLDFSGRLVPGAK